MFSANLTVTSELGAEFRNAQEVDSSIRAIKVVIVGEQILYKCSIAKNGDDESDFHSLLLNSHVDSSAACYILFLLSNSSVSSSANQSKSWLCIRWVPETCAVRDKMLYSSSHEDLKRGLGLGYFVDDYVCTAEDMLNWSVYQNSKLKENFSVLTVTEQTIKAEAVSLIFCLHFRVCRAILCQLISVICTCCLYS